jgi:hypothetical protein|tara:strand:- start:1236 stop:1427 length:192 start_codon:yes stop_codon:yes gene_type:complete
LRSYKPLGSDKYQSLLFNLKDDLGETKHLVTENQDKVEALSLLLDQWEQEMAETADPFSQSQN